MHVFQAPLGWACHRTGVLRRPPRYAFGGRSNWRQRQAGVVARLRQGGIKAFDKVKRQLCVTFLEMENDEIEPCLRNDAEQRLKVSKCILASAKDHQVVPEARRNLV